jgi:hypothetical protein
MILGLLYLPVLSLFTGKAIQVTPFGRAYHVHAVFAWSATWLVVIDTYLTAINCFSKQTVVFWS